MSDRASAPMSPPPPAPERQPTGRHRTVDAGASGTRRATDASDPEDVADLAAYAVRLGRENRAAIGGEPGAGGKGAVPGSLWHAIGRPPNPLTGEAATPGSLWAAFADVLTLAHRTDATVTAIRDRLDASDTANKGARGWFVARAEKLIDVLLVLALGAGIAYLAGFHR